MSCLPRSLLAALAVSMLIHAALFAREWIAPPPAARPQPEKSIPLSATLQPAPAAQPTPELILDEPESPPTPTAAASKPIVKKSEKQPKTAVDPGKTAKTWTQSIREQFSAQQRDGLFYPEAAIQQGLEGEALVLLLLDASGAVAAARIEQSSGHALLDEAALRAVRRLRSLPTDAPSESLLPVRFRLR
jgi:periplasmic protein TonB